jgi:glycosyltransferase involved in cell wall biosynthesis
VAHPAKVLEIIGYPPPHGGWSVRGAQLKKRLDAEGHDCVVLNIGESRRIPSPHYETVENGWVYLRKVWRYCRQGYLVHTHANGEATTAIALALVAELIAKFAGVGSVLTFHAGIDQEYFPRDKAPRWAPVFRLLFRLPHQTICNSDAVKARIVDYGVPAERIAAIPAFSRQYLDFTPVALSDEAERHFSEWPRTLFSYMSLRPAYYPEVLLAGFERLVAKDDSLGLFICGVGAHPHGEVAEKFHALVQNPVFKGRICLVGDLTHDQFLTAMTRSLAYVRTHVSDGVCSSVLEALALGVPVAACENGTRPAGVVTYPAEDAAALAAAVERAQLARGTAAPRRAAADVPDTVKQEVDLLASVLAPPAASRMTAA